MVRRSANHRFAARCGAQQLDDCRDNGDFFNPILGVLAARASTRFSFRRSSLYHGVYHAANGAARDYHWGVFAGGDHTDRV